MRREILRRTVRLIAPAVLLAAGLALATVPSGAEGVQDLGVQATDVGAPAVATPPAGVGLLIGSAMTIGYGPNNYGYLATNILNFSLNNSLPAANEFAIFQTHDPWGATVVKTAITTAGHTFAVFTPAQLSGFNFSSYRVVILNWDDTDVSAFNTPYSAAIPALEAYVRAGGVVWVQASIQNLGGTTFTMPFGGVETYDLSSSDFIVDTGSPMVAGAPNPITGGFASHATYTGLPGAAHVVIRKTNASGLPTLYDYRPNAPAITFTGAVGTGSPGYPGTSGTQTGRLFRDGIASTCGAPKTSPGIFDATGSRAYDAYTVKNNSGISQCVVVTINTACTGTNFIFPVGYLNSFNPSNLDQNYLADSGGSPNPNVTFSFLLAAGQQAALVIHEVTPAAGCGSYTVTVSGIPWTVPYDTDHDLITDRTVWRPSTGTWYTSRSKGGATATVWGASTDIDVMGDYDGDGKDDIAVFRPSTGDWFIVQSSNGAVRAQNWGASGDIPIAGDVDGDGRDDLVIYRNGNWFSYKSGGGTSFLGWGLGTDQPVLADYDGDGKADPGVFRPSNGFWYIYGSTGAVIVYGWGQSGDVPVPGNFDGDAKADIAVWRPSTGTWFVSNTSGGSTIQPWGTSGDIPVISDLDGDGKTDFTVWRPSSGTWFTLYAAGGTAFVPWGVSTDKVTGRRPGS